MKARPRRAPAHPVEAPGLENVVLQPCNERNRRSTAFSRPSDEDAAPLEHEVVRGQHVGPNIRERDRAAIAEIDDGVLVDLSHHGADGLEVFEDAPIELDHIAAVDAEVEDDVSPEDRSLEDEEIGLVRPLIVILGPRAATQDIVALAAV